MNKKVIITNFVWSAFAFSVVLGLCVAFYTDFNKPKPTIHWSEAKRIPPIEPQTGDTVFALIKEGVTQIKIVKKDCVYLLITNGVVVKQCNDSLKNK